MEKETQQNSNKLAAFKHDAMNSYIEYYKDYNTIRKRDMFFYWRGILHMYSISRELSNIETRRLVDFLINIYYKKKKHWFLNKYYYTLK